MNKNKTVFITGVSSGIGLATYNLLKKEGFFVFGIGRKFTDDIETEFKLHLDLSSEQQVKDFKFPKIDTDEIYLINNAGIIGEIDKIANLEKETELNVLMVNTISLMVLCRKLIQQFKGKKIKIINISSGAGKRPISGWSTYCASKAAVDMFSLCLQEEENERKSGVKVIAYSPGVVDTNMQTEIRRRNEQQFSSVQHFKNLKENDELLSPLTVANNILNVLNNDYPVLLTSKELI